MTINSVFFNIQKVRVIELYQKNSFRIYCLVKDVFMCMGGGGIRRCMLEGVINMDRRDTRLLHISLFPSKEGKINID